MYDVIGDVHGQGAKLRALLRQLGYAERADGWHAPAGRQAIFVGDLIDRGPEQLAVLQTVRRMVDNGSARLVLGNHEFNAIGYATPDDARGGHLRPRSEKNRHQHARFLAEVGLDSAEHRGWVDWFRQHPLALDLGGIRVVHAWWDDAAFQAVDAAWRAAGCRWTPELVQAAYDPSRLKAARQLLSCGVEMPLPEGRFILGKGGERFPEARLAVWRHGAQRLREIALVPGGNGDAVPDIPVPEAYRRGPVQGAPILFGHHWFSGPLALESPKVACLDWSAGKDGPLVAYRWDGEDELQAHRLVAAGAGGS